MKHRSAAERSWVAHIGLLALVIMAFAPLVLPSWTVEAPALFGQAPSESRSPLRRRRAGVDCRDRAAQHRRCQGAAQSQLRADAQPGRGRDGVLRRSRGDPAADHLRSRSPGLSPFAPAPTSWSTAIG